MEIEYTRKEKRTIMNNGIRVTAAWKCKAQLSLISKRVCVRLKLSHLKRIHTNEFIEVTI